VSALTYNPGVLSVHDMDHAMRIILTPEDSTTEARWRVETGYLADLIEGQLQVNPGTLLLDYGCGIGRLAKELIGRQDCAVVGADISPQMRMLAVQYVASERFFACAPSALDTLLAAGLRCDAAISVWVLQHARAPHEDVALICAALRPGAPFFVVNNIRRAVPTLEAGWADDGLDVKALLLESFDLEEEGVIPVDKTTLAISQGTYWARLRRRED
jgi:SAM-dependent methyltransferase